MSHCLQVKHRARKRLGQNFLQDDSVIAAIVAALAPTPEDALIEIGPGLGALTLPLWRRCPALIAIELDRDLAAHLPHGLRVMQQDACTVDFRQLSRTAGQLLRVVGNLPYNVSSPLLLHLVQQADAIGDVHCMLQKEVVDRILARPQTAAYGRLTVALQWRFQAELLFTVPPESFYPAPSVMSAVFRMTSKPDVAPIRLATLATVTRVAFSQRRKMLHNTLGIWLERLGYGGRFDCQRRAEEVPAAQYIDLALAIEHMVPLAP